MALGFVNFLYNWQTLITGFIALVAAYMTIRPIREQINLQKTQFESENKSKKWASKARLPDALSAICLYSVEVAALLRTPNENTLNPPIDAIREIKDIIQHVDEKASKRLFELLTEYQVQLARLRGFLGQTGRSRRHAELQDRYYDIVKLRALADSLFEYGRNEAADGPDSEITMAEMQTSLTTAVGIYYHGHEADYQGVRDAIARRHA